MGKKNNRGPGSGVRTPGKAKATTVRGSKGCSVKVIRTGDGYPMLAVDNGYVGTNTVLLTPAATIRLRDILNEEIAGRV